MSFRVLQNTKKVHVLFNDEIYSIVYLSVQYDGRQYFLSKKDNDVDDIDFYDMIEGRRTCLFGSPFNAIRRFYEIGNTPYLLASKGISGQEQPVNDRCDELFDIDGNPFLGFGGPIDKIRCLFEHETYTYLNGRITDSYCTTVDNVFRNDGKVMFPDDFYSFGSELELYNGVLHVGARRKSCDGEFFYNTDGYTKIRAYEPHVFYRRSVDIRDQNKRLISICQKERDDPLQLYNLKGRPLYPDMSVDERLIENVKDVYLGRDGLHTYFFDEKENCLDFMLIANYLENYHLLENHKHMIASVNSLDLSKYEKTNLLTAYVDTVLIMLDPTRGHFESRLAIVKDRLESMADTLGNYHGFEMIHFMGAS